MEVDIRQERTNSRVWRRPTGPLLDLPFRSYASGKPLPNQPQDALIGNAKLQERAEVRVIPCVEKRLDVDIYDPPHGLGRNHFVDRLDRLMGVASRAEAVRPRQKLLLVARCEDPRNGALHALIFDREEVQRSSPPIRLGKVNPPHRRGAVLGVPQFGQQLLQVGVERLFVVRCGDVVNPRRPAFPPSLPGLS